MTKGEPLPSRLVPPRSTKVGVEFGLPLVCCTLNPATAPESACAGLVWAPVLKVELSTLAIELVILERSCVPP